MDKLCPIECRRKHGPQDPRRSSCLFDILVSGEADGWTDQEIANYCYGIDASSVSIARRMHKADVEACKKKCTILRKRHKEV